VQFFTDDGRASRPFYFSEVDPGESAVTWQVDRASFDRMLLDHAREAGVQVREQANVRDVLFSGSQARGVAVEHADGAREEIAARVVVDASGQTGLLRRRFGLKLGDPKLRHAAFFTRYRGARRDPGIDGGATLVLRTTDNRCWFWFIPLPDDVTSVGVVGPIEHLTQGRSADPGVVYHEELARCPALMERVVGAEREDWFRVLRDFSYISSRISGDGWIMAGDAFGFLDPIYSTGLLLAFKAGEFAADAALEAFDKGDFSGAVLGQHGPRYVEGMETLRKLVYAYYDDSFSFGRFLKRRPDLRDPVTHLLTGNVFRVPVTGLVEALAEEYAVPESRRL
jgi:flavin-dependent dehydrogenase